MNKFKVGDQVFYGYGLSPIFKITKVNKSSYIVDKFKVDHYSYNIPIVEKTEGFRIPKNNPRLTLVPDIKFKVGDYIYVPGQLYSMLGYGININFDPKYTDAVWKIESVFKDIHTYKIALYFVDRRDNKPMEDPGCRYKHLSIYGIDHTYSKYESQVPAKDSQVVINPNAAQKQLAEIFGDEVVETEFEQGGVVEGGSPFGVVMNTSYGWTATVSGPADPFKVGDKIWSGISLRLGYDCSKLPKYEILKINECSYRVRNLETLEVDRIPKGFWVPLP